MSFSSDRARHLRRATQRFSLGTLLSKFSGLIRDMCLAKTFGVHPLLGAFTQAFRISYAIRRLLGEGAMVQAFIPTYEGLHRRDPARAARFFRDFSLGLSIALFGLVILVEGSLWVSIPLLPIEHPTAHWIAYFCQLMWPGVAFVCLNALNCALLQCENDFFFSGINPIIFNAIWTFGILACTPYPIEKRLLILSWLTVAAFAAQWTATTCVAFWRARAKWGDSPGIWHPLSPEVRGLFRFLGLGLVGAAGAQVNQLVDGFFAFGAEVGAVMHLYYAARLWQAPLSLIGTAFASVALPSIARALHREDFDGARHTLEYALRRSFHFISTATLALLTMGYPLIRLVFEREEFTPLASWSTARCLWGYALGLVPQVMVGQLSTVLYGLRLYKVTSLATLASVALNIACNAVFVLGFKGTSILIALATSLSSCLQLWLLFRYLANKYPHLCVHLLDAAALWRFFQGCATASMAAIASYALFGINPLARADEKILHKGNWIAALACQALIFGVWWLWNHHSSKKLQN